MDPLVKMSLKKAEDFYEKANEALNKPEEDVVPYTVCQNAYFAVNNYLSSYIEVHGREAKPNTGIKKLLQICRLLDDKFNDLHLSPMYDPEKTEDVWMNLDAAKDYLEMARNTRKLVKEN